MLDWSPSRGSSIGSFLPLPALGAPGVAGLVAPSLHLCLCLHEASPLCPLSSLIKVPVELGSVIICQVLNSCSLTIPRRLLEGSCFSLTAPQTLWILSAWKDWRREEKGMTEDEMVGWHHWLNGHEFEQAPGIGDGQDSLVCFNPWGRKESNTTERLNCTEHSCRVAVIKNGHKASAIPHVPLFIYFSAHSLFYFGIGLISDTVLVSEVWELDSVIYSHLSILFWVHFPPIEVYRVSSMLPFAVQQFCFFFFSPDSLFDVYSCLFVPCKLFVYPTSLTFF